MVASDLYPSNVSALLEHSLPKGRASLQSYLVLEATPVFLSSRAPSAAAVVRSRGAPLRPQASSRVIHIGV